jgi:hypothetical protein
MNRKQQQIIESIQKDSKVLFCQESEGPDSLSELFEKQVRAPPFDI